MSNEQKELVLEEMMPEAIRFASQLCESVGEAVAKALSESMENTENRKKKRTASEAIMGFLEWWHKNDPNEYEKGIELGLMFAQQIAEEVECNG